MAFSGTLVTSGQGKGVVVATGAGTEIGRISGLLSKVEMLTTPLVKQMSTFAKWLTIFILLIASLLLVYGYFVGHHDFAEMFMAVVGLSVAAIPEGLPAVLTITLAVGVQAMAKRNAIDTQRDDGGSRTHPSTPLHDGRNGTCARGSAEARK